MDEEKATKLLVERLVETHGQTFVTDTAHKKHLLEKAVSYYPVEYDKHFTLKFKIRFLNDSTYTVSASKLDELVKNYKEKLIERCSEVTAANYIFLENSHSFNISGQYSGTSSMSLMGGLSFFALIGKKEAKDLQRMFYKNVDLNIVRAMNSLNIKHFSGIYSSYRKGDDIVRYYRPQQAPDAFLELIFTLPEEDQVLGTNQAILRRFSSYVDYIEILTREYSGGKHFQDYFKCLDSGYQKQIFNSLTNVKERNLINDSFLWENGFKEVRLDHIELYKDNASKFIEYFKNRSLEEKKMILKDIMGYESTNEEVVRWLNENCLDIIREVGLNG